MFHDLDEALRQLLMKEIPIKNGEVDISFEQPKREWSARLSRPTLNLFLYDLRENRKLRQSQEWMIEQNRDGTVTQRRQPARVDLYYLVTAWANDPDDEHNLLARCLMALFRQPHLPEKLLPDSLHHQPAPIPLQVAQEEILSNPSDVWNVLDNEMRPAIVLTITLAIDPYQPLVTPLVRTRELRIGQAAEPLDEQLTDETSADVFWTIGGTVHTDQQIDTLRARLMEQGTEVPILEEGRFSIGKLKAGEYTLEISADSGKPTRHKIKVPAPDYDIQL